MESPDTVYEIAHQQDFGNIMYLASAKQLDSFCLARKSVDHAVWSGSTSQTSFKFSPAEVMQRLADFSRFWILLGHIGILAILAYSLPLGPSLASTSTCAMMRSPSYLGSTEKVLDPSKI